ncbi:hypothetical protein NKR19_g4929 [Coniochaeta hoffmannii]|uniref:Uncharacterized protein n=1 Tax=Coniochaeta hoffmannii TaxID=91930 RepID=A0AA38RVN1_9PEZI|nr:hypothetical protein NKR19_g4929 [Coniochaeta hoffmannii]
MGGGPTALEELKRLLTPELLTHIVNARLPYDKHAPIDFAEFGRNIFLEDNFGPVVQDRVWPTLIALSKVGLDGIPDLSTFLPPPTDASYPEQCLGLQLLLDHCPRLLFRGIDERWTYSYFMPLSERLAQIWHVLRTEQRPDGWDLWQKSAGLDYWIGVRFWFGTPFVHSERLEYQHTALEFTDETRTIVESETGVPDPWRAKRKETLADLTGYPRVYRAGPPQGEDVTPASWTYWMCMLMDIHVPIIEHYGRYPCQNAIRGRESTAEEKEWIEETTHFGETTQDVAKRVKEDIAAGRWTPLGTDSLGENRSEVRAALNTALDGKR